MSNLTIKVHSSIIKDYTTVDHWELECTLPNDVSKEVLDRVHTDLLKISQSLEFKVEE